MIKLERMYISNFKSISEFELQFSKFTCLIGLNSSGKSTILQAIDFIAQQMNGNFTKWLNDRDWVASELNSKLTKKKIIVAQISFMHNESYCIWTSNFNPSLKKCTYEDIVMYDIADTDYKNPVSIFRVQNSKYKIIKDLENSKILEGDIIQDYEGSFLSSLKSEFLPQSLNEFKSYMDNIYSHVYINNFQFKIYSRTIIFQ